MNSIQIAAEIASVVTGVAAVGGLALAVWQVSRNHQMTREATATDLFNQSLILSLEYPELAYPVKFDQMTEEDQNRYDWYMSSILLSAEEILSVTESHPQWRNSIKGNLYGHSEYLTMRHHGDFPSRDYYNVELVAVIEEIIAETSGGNHA